MARVLPQAVSDHFAAQQALASEAFGAVRSEWLQIGDDFDAGWPRVGPRITLLTGSAQLGAARNAVGYVPAALDEIGHNVKPDGAVNPRAFAGFASDGRRLDTLLYGAVVTARAAQVDTLTDRLAAGSDWLRMAVSTQVADAGRQAAGVSIASRPRTGYVRETGTKCCGRCAVLAGKFFRYNTGFDRHPSCQCVHVPATEGWAQRTALSAPSQITGISKAERDALGAGADLSQVVNARRGSSGMTTTANTSRDALRLTPEGIYRIASDRPQALSLLKAHGYLT